MQRGLFLAAACLNSKPFMQNRDFFGREIKLGDYFCRGQRAGEVSAGRIIGIATVTELGSTAPVSEFRAVEVVAHPPGSRRKTVIDRSDQLIVVLADSLPPEVLKKLC